MKNLLLKMENILVALTNLPAILSIRIAWMKGDTLTMLTLINVGLASFASHLFENHKHGMPGLGLSSQVSYYLNRLDVIGCSLTTLRLGYLYYQKYGITIFPIKYKDIVFALISFLLLRISEYDKYNSRLKWIYLPFHSLWHISIFILMHRFLKVYLY